VRRAAAGSVSGKFLQRPRHWPGARGLRECI